MSTSSLRRQMKNIVHNYSEAEIKVREATSNDPWGPSSSLMSEIADLTYNVVAFSEIMSMIWKRLNDHGKNWRHVYKAMTLMEYLIKTGSERVAQQCKENIYAIQTLKDFQYVDRDGKDQGVNVREKAKQLVSLLKDDERLKEERTHALKTKEKLAQTSTSTSGSTTVNPATEAEQAWPQSSGEEELQLQLALAMSKEEAEQVRQKEERIRRGDDLRLQMAIEESRKEAPSKQEESSLMDLADVFTAPAPVATTTDPWGQLSTPAADPWSTTNVTSTIQATSDPWGGPPVETGASTDPWGTGVQINTDSTHSWGRMLPSTSTDAKSFSDPWNPGGTPKNEGASNSDPWSFNSPVEQQIKQPADLWAPVSTSDPWGGTASKPSTNGTIGDTELLAGEVPISHSFGSKSPDSFDMRTMHDTLSDSTKPVCKTPESFLGPNAALVDLESLISKPTSQNSKLSNPFLVAGSTSTTTNPFQSNQQSSLTLNQLRSSPVMPLGQPVTPAAQTPAIVPFSSIPTLVPGIALGSTTPVVTVQPLGGLPVAPVAPGVPTMGLPTLMPPQQLATQPLIPNMTTQAATTSTNPFLL
uniref:ENTH domain-containing protein n=1 Tax=Leptobrachium leishanense TaxID=445787 RepID=A0A8C5PXC6_9ANUR